MHLENWPVVWPLKPRKGIYMINHGPPRSRHHSGMDRPYIVLDIGDKKINIGLIGGGALAFTSI